MEKGYRKCANCGGEGELPDSFTDEYFETTCSICLGKGKLSPERQKNLHIQICERIKAGFPCPKYPDVIKK